MAENQQSSDEKKQNKSQKKITIPVFVASLLGTFVVSVGLTLIIIMNANGAASTTTDSPAGFDKFITVYSTIMDKYYKKVDSNKLMTGAIDGMISSLDDPFSEYLPKTDATSLNNTITGSFVGIGAQVKQGETYLEVASPIDGSPAKKAGIKADDLIIKIDGKTTKGISVTKGVKLIKGKKGTKVTLTIQRGDQTFDLKITRGTVPVKTVTYKLDKTDKKIGNITISSFSEPTFDELKSAIKALRKEGATKFILDVRGNPGGLLDSGVAISSMFLKNGKTITSIKPRTGKSTVYTAGKKYDGGFKITEPVVVLIDGGTASAAEIFGGALNQSAGISLIGTKSYGKGSMQEMTPFTDESEFKITEAKWLTPNGSWINKKGLTPTIKADYPAYAYANIISTKKDLKYDQVSDSVKNLQILLTALGYHPGTANGYYSATTESAVRVFQTKNGLADTGVANSKTIKLVMTQIQALISQNDNTYKAATTALK